MKRIHDSETNVCTKPKPCESCKHIHRIAKPKCMCVCVCYMRCKEGLNWIWSGCGEFKTIAFSMKKWRVTHTYTKIDREREHRGNEIEIEVREQKNKNFSNYGKPEKLNKSGMRTVLCVYVWLACSLSWCCFIQFIFAWQFSIIANYHQPTNVLFTSIHSDTYTLFFSSSLLKLHIRS